MTELIIKITISFLQKASDSLIPISKKLPRSFWCPVFIPYYSVSSQL